MTSLEGRLHLGLALSLALLIGGAAIALVYLLAAPWIVKLMHGVR